MTRHRYPVGALLGDYVRAALGLAVTVAPLALMPVNRWVGAVLAALAAIFLAFGMGAVLRQLRTIALDESGIAAEGLFPTRLDWAALDRVSLRYFALRRERTGWMQLVLRAGRRRLALDSRIEGFNAIAAAAAAAAERRGLALGEATLANFTALGIAVGGADPGWFGRRNEAAAPAQRYGTRR